MKSLKFKINEDMHPQLVLSKQRDQEMEREKILKCIKKKSDILHKKNSRFINKPMPLDGSRCAITSYSQF
jgi:hypothetical protein